ncbi:hypothetical protein TTHERM_00691330 (macronuclear) [Tetrahymena thermophila SB210]|uniref:Uncharacterized protein n=1 Tax=Tetrahymena thermophila (strain SB210) TaxID=312017 RepID=I7M664_TETTS|nr:hypothetical protein TTHERM_00691330 [Tetrahymena thermophila SB210]EAR84435.2 hypothetical protein TTHERM_00691330 [Tetrahymena thermophila SB210]|eukprot:XP_001032098.2 hypothetical protein TTHERM_00691330 [Tetrahymena thermophila SB210]
MIGNQQEQNADSKEEEDLFFSRVMEYTNSKLQHQTQGNQVFFRSFSMSPNRFSQRENLPNQKSLRNFIPSSSAQTGGFFTSRQNQQKRDYIQQLISSSQNSKEYFQKVNQTNGNINKIQTTDVDKENYSKKDSEQKAILFQTPNQQITNKSQGDNDAINFGDEKQFCINSKQTSVIGEQKIYFAQKIQDYTQELKDLIKSVQENNSIETVHNKLIREMIQKQFRNVEAIPVESYYESIQEFKDYFQSQLHEIQKCIQQVTNSNKQIKQYEDKLKAFVEESNLQNNISENNDYNSFNFQDNIQQHSFNPNQQQSSIQVQSLNSKDELNNGVLQDSIQKGYINNLNQVSKQLQLQVEKLLMQLQKQFEQKDEEIDFLLEQQSIERQDYQRQINLKQEEINIVLQNHNHLSNIYREKVQSLEQMNVSLQNRIEDILFLGQKREQSLQEEVNQLREVVKTLEKYLQLPVNQQKLSKNQFVDDVCCSKCGSTQIIYMQKINFQEKQYQGEHFSEKSSQQLEVKRQGIIKQPIILTQSHFEKNLEQIQPINQLDQNTTSTDDNSAKKSKQNRSIFLKKSQTPSNIMKKQFFVDSQLSDKKERPIALDQQSYQDIPVQLNNFQNVEQYQSCKQLLDNKQLLCSDMQITYNDLQKEFQELKMTPFNIKIDVLSEYFTKILNCLQQEIYAKNNSILYDQIKEFNKQMVVQIENFYQKLNLFSESFDQKVEGFKQRVEQFENLTKYPKVSKNQIMCNQSNQEIKSQINLNENNQTVSKEEFNSFLKDKIQQQNANLQLKTFNLEYLEKSFSEINQFIEKILQDNQGQIKEFKLPQEVTIKLQQNIDRLLSIQANTQGEKDHNDIHRYYQNVNQTDKQYFIQSQQQNLINNDKSDLTNYLRIEDSNQDHELQYQDDLKVNFQQAELLGNRDHIKFNDKILDNSQLKNDGMNMNILNNISIQTSQQSSHQLMELQKEKSTYSENQSQQTSNKKSNIFKQNNNKIFQAKLIKENKQIQQDINQLINVQLTLIQQECREILYKVNEKFALFTQQSSQFNDFSEFYKILSQILEELKVCKMNDQKRYSLDAKVNEAIMKENSILKNQLQEQKEYYDKELESAIQNLILHQEFFEEKKKIYENMNQQYKASISLFNSEIKRRNNQVMSNFDLLNDSLIQIQNNIQSIMRIEKKILVNSSKENNGTFVAVEAVRNEIQNIFSIQIKKLNNFISIKKKILDKFNRIEAHEGLITHYKLKGKVEQLYQNIQRFEKQNDFLEIKLTEEKKGCKYLIKMQQQYYESLFNYLNSSNNQ